MKKIDGQKVLRYFLSNIYNMENKPPTLIDENRINTRARRKLRRYAGVRNDVEAFLVVTRDMGIPVEGVRESTQIKNAYKIIANFYNIDTRAEIKKYQAKKRGRRSELMKLDRLIKNYKTSGNNVDIPLSGYKHLTGQEIIQRINRRLMGEVNGAIQMGGRYFKMGDLHFNPEQRNEYGSDVETALEYVSNVSVITLRRFNATRYRRRFGAFFPFKNRTKLDLTRYGIFTNVNSVNYEYNCLVWALLMFGVPNGKLREVKRMLNSEYVPKSKLDIIAETIQYQIHVHEDGARNVYKYGKQFDTIIHIGLIHEHYFLLDDFEITTFALEHYHEICHLDNFESITSKRGKYFERHNGRTMNSMILIKKCIELKLFEPMTASDIAGCQYHKLIEETYEDLSYDESKCEPIEPKKIKHIKYQVMMFDFETYAEIGTGKHIPYLCCAFDGEHLYRFYGEDCGLQFLKSLKKDTLLYAHNATYDKTFILPHLNNISDISRGNHLLALSGEFCKRKILIKDTYNIITMPLSKFGETFKMDVEKEVMPYGLYSKETLEKRWVPIVDAFPFIDDKERFLANIIKWKCKKGDLFDILEYSANYCDMDCIVLHRGWFKFREWVLEGLKIDINDTITSASLSHHYFVKEGCFKGVYKLTGTPQSFIQKSLVGGRCMIANNKKKTVNDVVNDCDATSLYPSAMDRMGYLKGLPKVITVAFQSAGFSPRSTDGEATKGGYGGVPPSDWSKKEEWDGYFVEIKLTKIGIHRAFPLMSYIDENGVRQFVNEMEGRIMYVDKTTLEDMIEFQKIEYEFIKGYYFDEGRNYTIQKVIRYIFNKRLELKKDKNPAENIYKLLMNSAYGKTIMKPIETESLYFNNQLAFENYWVMNHAFIHSGDEFGNIRRIKKIIPIINHSNIPQVGCEILSMSKRIMNEVMCTAEDNGIELFYQDTDSIHMLDLEIPKLTKCFEAKYGRKFIGKSMGQFHSDFNVDGCKDVVAVKSMFLAKKCYLDVLLGDCHKEDYHIRMKSIPNDVILNHCKKTNQSVIDLYQGLFEGKKEEFDLTDGSLRFYYKDFNVFTQSLFKRTISF